MPASRSSDEQLAAAAADVEHRRVAAQQLDVGLEQLAHALLRPAEDVLEARVGAVLPGLGLLGDVGLGVELGLEPVEPAVGFAKRALELPHRVLEPVARAFEVLDPDRKQRLELALADEIRAQQPQQQSAVEPADHARA